jgi:PAS domain S-box-containing protein
MAEGVIISLPVKSERLGKRKRSQRPTDGVGGSKFENAAALLKFPVVRTTNIRAAGRAKVFKTRPSSFLNGSVHASPGGLVEAALAVVRNSEIRYRRLFEAAHDGILILDPKARKITDVNPFMIELLGYTHAEFVGKELWEIGLLKDQSASRKMFRELREKHFIRYEDLPLKTTKGQTREVEVVANLYKEDQCPVIQCNIRDITTRKHAEQELSEKARLLDLSHDAIIVRDLKGHIRYWNHGAEELYGWSRKEALGKISHLLLRTEFPIPLKQMADELHRTDRWIGELVHTNRAGRRLTVLARKTLDRDRQGNPAAVLENITDITDRKEIEGQLRISESRYRRLFEAAHDGILILDTETRKITDVNPFMIELLGYTYGEFVGKELWEIGLLKDQKASRKMFQELREKHYVRYDDLPLATKLGERRQVEFVSNRYKDNGHDVIQCNIRDIAERKELEVELHQLSGRLLRLQDEERRRIGRELHDSTAQELAAVAMNLGLVQQGISGRDLTTDNHLADSQAIIEQCQREIRTLTYQLHPPVLDEVGLASAVREYADGFMQRSGMKVTLDISPALGRLPAETERALFRVVQEGLGNVHRHSGSATATIRIGRKSTGVVLEVKDEGHGLPRKMLVRGDCSVSKVGVGIAGMRERLCQLGGRFEIESSRRGTTLRAIVPRETGEDGTPCKS